MTTDSRPLVDATTVAGVPATVLLARGARRMRERGLDEATRHGAVRAAVDWFSATAAGAVLPPARILGDVLLGEATGGRSRLVVDGRSTTARTAALINGTASHTVEMDDIFRDGIYHPGSPTVAAALAVAERVGASGERFLSALAVGYEVGSRVAAAVNPSHYRYWHTTGTVGTLGAAAAVAELLDLDVEPFAHALATATTMAAGLQQAFRSEAMSKPLHAGHAAEAGVLAALAAAAGYTGALDVLDGPAGFGAAMSDKPDWIAAAAAMEGTAAISQATVKNHACCGHTFAAVDAALELRRRGVDPDEIAELEVVTYTTATTVAGIARPTSDFEAKFSTAYCVAVALVTGSVRLAAFTEPTLSDPRVRALCERVRLVADPAMEARFPGQRMARIIARDLAGGTVVVQRDTRKGDPDDPLSDTELREKFTELVRPVYGEDGAANLATALWGLPFLDNVCNLPLAAVDPGTGRPR